MQKFVDGYLEAVACVYSEGEPVTGLRTVLQPTEGSNVVTADSAPLLIAQRRKVMWTTAFIKK